MICIAENQFVFFHMKYVNFVESSSRVDKKEVGKNALKMTGMIG